MTDAQTLTHELGGKWHGGPHGYGVARCVAHDDRTPSLSIRDGDERLLVHCHAGCDSRDVLDALRRRGLIDGYAYTLEPKRKRPEVNRLCRHGHALLRSVATAHPRPALHRQDRDSSHAKHHAASDRAAKARWLWSNRHPIAGSIAERYLRTRGYSGPLPTTLGFLPARKSDQHPAMVAAFAIPTEPEPGILGQPCNVDAIHLTLLKRDGSGKADVTPNKLFVGSPGCHPIVLAPPNEILGLAISEGIEDGLSIYQATGLGSWAAGAAGAMPALADTVPSYIECVTILAHPDPAGQNGARALANALIARGIEVLVQGDDLKS
jgi:hypothetical protein